jgi:hypothetical protein
MTYTIVHSVMMIRCNYIDHHLPHVEYIINVTLDSSPFAPARSACIVEEMCCEIQTQLVQNSPQGSGGSQHIKLSRELSQSSKTRFR